MSDFNSYRRVLRPRTGFFCDTCREMTHVDAVRIVGVCEDGHGKRIMTSWSCMACHKERIKALGERLEQEGDKEPWLRAEVAAMLKALPPLVLL